MLYGAHWYFIVAAVVVYFAIGALWYSPLLFSKMWMKALGKDMSKMGDMKSAMAVTALAMLLLVAVEAYFIQVTGTSGAWRGAYLGAKLWLGFTATTALINNTFQSQSKKLFAIDQGYHLVGMVLAGLILAL